MMGKHKSMQPNLFYINFNLNQRVRKKHPLRRIKKLIDFDFIYKEVRDKYGINGNTSVPPPVILKLILLLTLYNVESERELMETLPERLDWLLFLGYDIDDKTPDHSVLSKARRRWGLEAFRIFFERIVWQCVEAGLVDGSKIFCDSSLIEADASNNSVVNRKGIKEHIRQVYPVLEDRLDEKVTESETDDNDKDKGIGNVNRKHVSKTDPDATVVRQGKGKSRLRYKTHRAVDSSYGVITATELTTGAVNEAHRMESLIKTHRYNTGRSAETVVCDTKYGTVENYLFCNDHGIKAHMPDLKEAQAKKGLRGKIFSGEVFKYDAETDSYRCPAGEVLKRRRHKKKKQAVEYATSAKTCAACKLRQECTTSKTGRSVKRHNRQEDLDIMRQRAEDAEAKRDIKFRQHFMERSYAESTRYGFKRARWRRLWRVAIQDYLVAAVQNIKVLIRHGYKPKRALEGKGKPTLLKQNGFIPYITENIWKLFVRLSLSDHFAT